MKHLLVELCVEELPPKSLKKLGDAFANGIYQSLKQQDILAPTSKLQSFATPRRLAVLINDVLLQGPEKQIVHKLMPVSVGINAESKASPALIKKLNTLGLDESVFSELQKKPDGRGDSLFFETMAQGMVLEEALKKALDETLQKLPIPKVMSYQLQDGWETVNFVRPAHSLIALYGEKIIPLATLGLESGRSTFTHRFEANKKIIDIQSAEHYESQLFENGSIIASFAKRRQMIVDQLTSEANKLGLKPIQDEALLDEVTSLVELPNVLLGEFETEYLEVPQECLILTMKSNQKYFPLLDASGKLTNKFLLVSNIKPEDPTLIISGNERVVRPRLADAKFFFDQDRKKKLQDRISLLNKVVYQNKLGSQGERNLRVQKLAISIAERLDKNLVPKAELAASLSKADLLTEMVGEFPELQGIMGRYYALHDGHSEDVAYAIEDHYRPRFAGDDLPRNKVGICVALADKMETLVGMFGIGKSPTGDKDPYALRRHGLGILRMVLEQKFSVKDLIDDAFNVFPQGLIKDKKIEVYQFLMERLSGMLKEQGFKATEIEAILSLNPVNLHIIPDQLHAVQNFLKLSEAESLAAANKRVGNILKKFPSQTEVTDSSLLAEDGEKKLHEVLKIVQTKVDNSLSAGNYSETLQVLAELKNPVDGFFETVMVQCEDEKIKINRIRLLTELQNTMNRFADISKLF